MWKWIKRAYSKLQPNQKLALWDMMVWIIRAHKNGAKLPEPILEKSPVGAGKTMVNCI